MKKNKDIETEVKPEKISKDEKKMQTLKDEIAELEKQVADWKNKYYMAFADTENLRKQYDKDHREALKYRATGFVEKLLPVLDSFHVALSGQVDDQKLKNYLIGFTYIFRQLVDALESEGVKELAPKIGDKFDERTMHALDSEARDDVEANTIVRVYTNGFMLADRLIRPAQVIVAKKVEDAVEQKTEQVNNDLN